MKKARIKALVFDVDGTISEPNFPIKKDMATAILSLLSVRGLRVCILTAKSFPQIQVQVLNELIGVTSRRLGKLHLGVLQGTEIYSYNSLTKTWNGSADDFIISYDDEQFIRYVLERAAKTCGLWNPDILSPSARYIENRGGQITFQGLGNEADPNEKRVWDPDGEKRKRIVAEAQSIAPQFEYRIGGTTSIDVTVAGQNKATGLKKMLEKLNLKPSEIIYFGDEMDEGGNDYPVLQTGLYDVRKVSKPDETLAEINAFLVKVRENKLILP